MAKILSSLAAAAALLFAFTSPAMAEQSRRGFYESNLPSGGKIVFFASGNKAISVYAFDFANQKTYFGSGNIDQDGTFTIELTGGGTITGTLSDGEVTATFLSQNLTADRVQLFGAFNGLAGRFNGLVHSRLGNLDDVRFLIDSDGHIFFVGKDGDRVVGGHGNVSNVGERKRHHGKGDNDGDDDGDDDDGDGDDDDEDRDEHQDENIKFFNGTFTITLSNGITITGTFDFSRGHLTVRFSLNGMEFVFRGDRDATFNRLANISTRAFVNTGQGQLIGGFIITGGPKLVLVRALGPSLAAQGITQPLANPKLQLFDGDTLLRENDDWRSNSNAGDLEKSTIPPTNAKEAAILMRLEPGAYTTVVTGADGGTGIALVEVYEVDRD